MPTGAFGQKLNIDTRGNFISLTKKGEQLRFRIVDPVGDVKFVYQGKHFIDVGMDKKEAVDCPRVMHDTTCDICDKYFELMNDLKPLKKDAEAAKEAKDYARYGELNARYEDGKKQASEFKAAVTFYLPVIDRETQSAGILKTTVGIRGELESKFTAGIKIYDVDWLLIRTELPGKYYDLSTIDSKETLPLTEKETAEYQKAQHWDLVRMCGGKESSANFTEEPAQPEPNKEEMTDKIDVDSIPF